MGSKSIQTVVEFTNGCSYLLKSPGLFSVFWPMLNAVVWMISTSHFLYLLVPLPNIYRLFRVTQWQIISPSPSRSVGLRTNLYFPFILFLFYGLPEQQSPLLCKFSFSFFFLLTITRSSLQDEIRESVCIIKCQKMLYVSFSKTRSVLCIYDLFAWTVLNFLHNSQWTTYPTQLCLVIYSFCANLRHSLILCCTWCFHFKTFFV